MRFPFARRSASGSKAPTTMPENVCMQATPSITHVLIVAMPRPISRSGKMPRACVITMVPEALKKPMARMAPMGTQIGGCDASARVASMEMITRLPPMAIHLRVSSRRSSGPKTSMPSW